jgi:single-stranded-DNA-specific exonuclease
VSRKQIPLPRWEVKDGPPPPGELDHWAAHLGITPRLARLLWQRGLSSITDMDVFLSPNLRHLSPLEQWPGLAEAADHLAGTIAGGKRCAVWGDYDVDGITATALLIEFLRNKGFDPLFHIPRRIEEGYGLNSQGIERLADSGAEVLITVDCGIVNMAEIERARELGMEVVVTDHHLPGIELPRCHGLVNPRVADCPCVDLAGVGVAFLLAAALNSRLPGKRLDMRRYLDLVALGTVADVVRLLGENRILVKNGLLLLSDPHRPGIRALKAACGLEPKSQVGSGEINFALAPRINAAGRMGDPQIALRLLLTSDETEARGLASELEQWNAERRSEEDAILTQATAQAEAFPDAAGLVLCSTEWHPGVIGIVASRVVERFNRPCLVLTGDEVTLKGSGRSIPEFDLHKGLISCRELLLRFGGHRLAAGFALVPSNLDLLRERFHSAVIEQIGADPLPPLVRVDDKLSLKDLSPILLKEIELMQPFGQGNPRPLFASPLLEVRSQRIFGGGGKHLGLHVRERDSGVTLRGTAWRMAETLQGADLTGSSIAVAYSPRLSLYGGMTSIELAVKSILEIR